MRRTIVKQRLGVSQWVGRAGPVVIDSPGFRSYVSIIIVVIDGDGIRSCAQGSGHHPARTAIVKASFYDPAVDPTYASTSGRLLQCRRKKGDGTKSHGICRRSAAVITPSNNLELISPRWTR
jgi:hypothetical protein